ncbi:hypothetical protein CHS0354_031397 [Potamilus streckersoni]|nr:hypothetical protein CHS0354_031397 [Potamilus streckersoni]
MNMQDFINNVSPRCASVLNSPVTTPGLSNPVASTIVFNPNTTHVVSNSVTTPVLSNAITVPVLSNPVTIPDVSNTVTTLSSEATLEVNQPSVSTSSSSNENQRNNRFDPYQSTSLTFSRMPRRYRSRQYTRAYSVCFYSKSILPLRVNRSWTCFLLETVIDILMDDREDDIRGKLVDLLLVKHGYHHITRGDLVFLKSARRQLDLPVSPPEFQWNGDKIRRLIGSGKFHVMVQIEMMTDSSFSTSCSVDVCERNDPRRRQLAEPTSSLIPQSRLNQQMAAGNDSVESMDDEEAVAEVIRRSLTHQNQPYRPNAASYSGESNNNIARALREHADRIVRGFKRYIMIKREDLWNSALEFFKRPNFIKESGTLSVKFQIQDGITEEASDFSGPKREFFRLLIGEICQKSGALVETPNGLIPRNNIRQLQEGVLRHIGRMISTIVLQGGEAPAIFSPIITQCILNDPVSTKPDVDDIPDIVIRESLKLVQQANNQESLEAALNSCDWRFDVDGLPLFVKMENKEEFIQASAMYFAILQRQTGIQQLLQGLEYYDFLELMKKKPFICSILEYNKGDISAKDLISMMKPEYSYLANRKEREEKIFANLKEFLQLVEDRTLLHRLADLTTEEREFISTMKPSKLLEFCTGSSKIPPLGLKDEPHITFAHREDKFHPSAHTCGNKFVLYVNDKTVNDQRHFFKIMVETLMNAEHFGFG